MNWITENLATLLIGGGLAFAVTAILVTQIRNKKRGKHSCGCGCTGCPMKGVCHQKRQTNDLKL